jgi:xylan 1,4-beta-xylosidase
VITALTGGHDEMNYHNPIIPGFHPDPSICRVEDAYYLVTSSFEYFPGVPLFFSRDLVHWKQIGHCLTRANQLNLLNEPNSGGIYAPTIRHHNGRFYMITTLISRGNFFVWTDDPCGEWSDPVWLEQGGIDPSLFFDESGKVYMTSNGGGSRPGIYQCELDIGSGRRLTESRFIWEGTGGAYAEAPHLYKISGLYYLMISEGGTEHGHMVTMARSDDVYGPYSPCPSNPVLTHRSLPTSIKAVGHADLVQAHDDSWWAVCLGIRPVPYPWRHHLGRETFLAPVVWDAGGWPVIGDNGVIHEVMEAPGLPRHAWPDDGCRDDFDEPKLKTCWNHIRSPYEKSYSLAERKGHLALAGSAVTLDDQDSPTFLGRRQEHFNCVVQAELDFEPRCQGEEAGLTVILNEKFHYEIAIARLDGRRKIIFRRRLGSLQKMENCLDIPDGAVVLAISADHENYAFSYSMRGEPAKQVGTGECWLLSTEVGGRFTGAFFGLYATGNGSKSSTIAYFDWFDYITSEKQWSLTGSE